MRNRLQNLSLGAWLAIAYAALFLFPLIWGVVHAPESRWRILESILIFAALLLALRYAFNWAAGKEEREESIHDRH
jgi:hypothetical protein